MTISQRIFALLREKKLSQKELSEYTGISPAAISSWKSKGTNPSSDKIVKISEFLDVDVYYLPVSYTHLDVYKRQAQDSSILVFLLFVVRYNTLYIVLFPISILHSYNKLHHNRFLVLIVRRNFPSLNYRDNFPF